ncbi:phospholipid carrier-dependent glycosyltransferase, partial [archaeon]|nr:phospholipid carrier-dependent glycosyltransferase [archaeon]
MTKKKTKENKILLLLFLLCICFSFSNYLILTKDNTPFHYDILDSYLLSKKLYNSFTTFGVSGLFYSIANDYDKDYPILFILQPFPFFYVFGVFEDSAAFSNIPYIFILIFSTYFIGKELKNKKAGFIACLILLFISGILSFSRVYLPVFPLTSIFMLSVFIFLRTKNFKKTNYSFGLGIIAALGLLIKYTFVLYLFPFVFSFLLENLITNIKKKNKLIEEIQIKNFFYFVCTFLTISILGYLSFSSSSAFINSKSAWPSVLGYLSIAHTTFGSGNIITYIFKVSYEFIKRSNILFLGIYPLIILSFIYSLYTTLKNKILRPLIMCVCLSFFLVIYIGPVPRFILPLVPLLIILLSINFVEIYNYLKKKKRLEKFNFNHFVLTVLVFIILLFSIGLIKEKKK